MGGGLGRDLVGGDGRHERNAFYAQIMTRVVMVMLVLCFPVGCFP